MSSLLKRISGSKTVLVPITTVGKNYLPFVEDLRDRYIKYIDFCPVASLPYSSGTAVTASSKHIISLSNKAGNVYDLQDIPLQKFDISLNWGIRPAIMRKLSLQNSYIMCTDVSEVGKVAVLVFYYDNMENSRRNTTTDVAVNGFEVQIKSATYANQFPDNRTMVGKNFRNLFFSPVSLTPNLNTGFTENQMKDLYITLQRGNYAVLDTLPLMCLYGINMVEPLEFANIQFDFTNSFVLVGGNGSNASYVGKYLFLNASYENK